MNEIYFTSVLSITKKFIKVNAFFNVFLQLYLKNSKKITVFYNKKNLLKSILNTKGHPDQKLHNLNIL